jgi:hypothetical protein
MRSSAIEVAAAAADTLEECLGFLICLDRDAPANFCQQAS